MANGHGGDRRSAQVAPTAYTNRRLLKEMHRLECERLLESEQDGSQEVVEIPWPDNYELIVAEAQRRKLCL